MSLLCKTLRIDSTGRREAPCGLAIRPFSIDRDMASLSDLGAACGGLDTEPPVPTATFRGVLEGRPGRDVLAWIACDESLPGDRGVRGFLALVVAPPRHSIGWLLVHPVARRRGVGTALVDRAVAEAALLGAREVHVETHTGWAAAVAFWNRMAIRHS